MALHYITIKLYIYKNRPIFVWCVNDLSCFYAFFLSLFSGLRASKFTHIINSMGFFLLIFIQKTAWPCRGEYCFGLCIPGWIVDGGMDGWVIQWMNERKGFHFSFQISLPSTFTLLCVVDFYLFIFFISRTKFSWFSFSLPRICASADLD